MASELFYLSDKDKATIEKWIELQRPFADLTFVKNSESYLQALNHLYHALHDRGEII